MEIYGIEIREETFGTKTDFKNSCVKDNFFTHKNKARLEVENVIGRYRLNAYYMGNEFDIGRVDLDHTRIIIRNPKTESAMEVNVYVIRRNLVN